MAIRRACSYEATIKTPVAPSNYSAILVTFQQGGVNLVEKERSELTLTDSAVVVKLTLAETALFEAKKKAFMQVRCYASTYDAPGSAVWSIPVEEALNDEVLP